MRVFRPTYTRAVPKDAKIVTCKGEKFAKFTKKGKTCTVPVTTTKKGDRLLFESPCYCINFVDRRQIRRKLPAYTDRRASERLGHLIEQLLCCNGIVTPDLQRSIEGLPEKQRSKLIEWGLIDNQRLSEHLGRPLAEHLQDFERSLYAKENTPRYAKQIASRVQSIFDACGFRLWSDIDANRVYTHLADLRKDDGISQRTFNYYLKAAKQFAKWMLKERRASSNPLEHLSCIRQTEKRVRRRALTLDEQQRLLTVTAAAEPHHNMTGLERSYLYRLAIQTGLRSSELKSLTKSSFDFGECTVTVEAGYTKNRRPAEIDLKRRTAAELAILLANKLPPDAKAFAMPDQPAKMLKKDLALAGIPYRTDEGTADFHSLRHSAITNWARQGVHPKDAQTLARHSTITLTMDHYTHAKRESLRAIIEHGPDLTVEKQEQKKLG